MKCYIGIISFLILWTSCGQLSTLQTAKSIGKNNIAVGGAAFGYGVNDLSANGGDLGAVLLPHVELLGRYGINDQADIGLKLSSGGNALLDGKYQIVGDQSSTFAMALGGGFEYQFTRVGNDTQVFRTHLPLYLSYHLKSDIAIYAGPRYVWQYVSDDNSSHFIGSGFGMAYPFSPNTTGLLELNVHNVFTDNESNSGVLIYQFGLGFKYRFIR